MFQSGVIPPRHEYRGLLAQVDEEILIPLLLFLTDVNPADS